MSAAEIASWIGGGAGLTGLSVAVGALFKARPEAKKINAEATKVITEASASFVANVTGQLDRMSTKVAEVEKKLEEREVREERQERLLLVHERWDLAIADQVRQLGGHVADPPPLYPDPATA